MNPYTHETLDSLKTKISIRLSDEGQVFFTNDELGYYINAALREFNSIARIFRDRGSFSTTAPHTFYDLRTLLKNGDGEAFLNPVIIKGELLVQFKYMLIEPNPTDSSSFTDGFSLDGFNNAFVQARYQFLLETGIYVEQVTPQIISAGEGRIALDDTFIIDVRRASWTALDGAVTQLLREDEFTSSAFSPDWPQDAGTPQRYSIYPDPLLTLQLIPPPTDNGTLTLQSVSALTVPDDFTPFILWGILADALSGPGPGNDPLRAAYAQQRWNEGIIVGRQYATLQQAFINGVPATIESVYDLDTFQLDWNTAGAPTSVAALGSNLVALAPEANDTYSVVIDAVRNAPKLVNGTDYFPLGREYLNGFIDYVCHLAAFKQGGQEFQATLPQYDAFVKMAIAYNNRMYSQNLHFDTLIDKAQSQEQQQSLRKEEAA